jgi:Carboxypeptidase regulatory-like domain
VILVAGFLAVTVSVPPTETGFRFRRTVGQLPTLGVPLEIGTPGGTVRADVLVDDGGGPPRWRWFDGGGSDRGHVTLRAPANAHALLVFLRASPTHGYELEGPFRWPASAGSRDSRPLPRRTLRGTHPLASGAEVHLVGSPVADPLCESDLAGRWQCLAVPLDFIGRVVACDGRNARAATKVRRGSEDEVPMREVVTAVAVRVVGPEPPPDAAAISVRLLRAVAAGGIVLARDPSSEVEKLEEGLFWLESRNDSAGLSVEVSAGGFATVRLPLSGLRSDCGTPGIVELSRATPLAGTVHEREERPVAGATVLVRSADSDHDGAVLADVVTEENGGFEIPDLEPRRYRVRACHAGFGCGAAVSTPGEPVRIVLDGGGAFVGRVLTASGVPEPAASVRITPSLVTATRGGDRLSRMPLETLSESDGRFRIFAPDSGDFLVEIRAESTGVVRIPVRRSPTSPPVTDLGDVRLPERLEIAVRVVRCGGGTLSMSGPLDGQTSLPTFARFPLDADGTAVARLPEGGTWTAWATCGGAGVVLSPALLPDVAALAGIEVRLEPVGALGRQSVGRSK